MPSRPAPSARRLLVAALVAATLLSGCTPPISVTRADPRAVHRTLTANVLSQGRLSDATRNVLAAHDLTTRFARAPEPALAELHAAVVANPDDAGVLFALAELSFVHAERSGRRWYYLASAVYAYAFLFPAGAGLPGDAADGGPSPFDPRARVACDLYNRGLTAAFASADGRRVEPRAGAFRLPFGEMDVAFDPADLEWEGRELTRFVPVAELDVRGFHSRHRWFGLGAPLAASIVPRHPERARRDLVAPRLKVPVTALLRLEEPRRQLARRRLRGTLELHIALAGESVEIDGREVPLEAEPTAALAYMMAEGRPWEREVRGFLQRIGAVEEKTRLVALQPHRAGRIPIVFVHGTASSIARWAELVNELFGDAAIRARFEFWFFSYDTGNPIPYSAMLLREALARAVAMLDPDGRDPALRRLVVVGHSQGGLLAKMTAIDSGTRLWDIVSRKPLAEISVRPQTRDLLGRALFVTPVPEVRRVVFIATPQRGSYVAGGDVAQWLTRFITLPVDLVRLSGDLLAGPEGAFLLGTGRLPTSVDNMAPGSPFIETLAAIPMTPGVTAHSVIAVAGDGPVAEGSDGVVAYASAHLDDVESELVVRSGHSCQSNPYVIAEVRRILHVHAAAE